MALDPEPTERPAPDITLELVARIQGGDRVAFGELYERYHDEMLFAVRAHLGTRLRSALESEDVLQSVVIEAFKALPGFEPRGPGSLRQFLHAMIVNKIRSRARYFDADKRAGTRPLSDSVADRLPQPTNEPTYHESERYERLEIHVQQLPDEMRRVLILRKVDGLASAEVARIMGRSDAAVRKLYSRALARLATQMGSAREAR